MLRKLYLFTSIIAVYSLFISWTEDGDKKKISDCNRKQLEGLYTYLASPTTYVYREANQMTEKLSDIGVITQYDIHWQSTSTCDHQLIVKKVTTTSRTPESMKPYLLAVGDVLNITVIEVNDHYMSFKTRWKDKTTEERMERITDEMLFGK